MSPRAHDCYYSFSRSSLPDTRPRLVRTITQCFEVTSDWDRRLVIGMLTFIMYYLLKNPEAMRKLREEVDTMIGSRLMTVDDVNKLPYLIGKLNPVLTKRR